MQPRRHRAVWALALAPISIVVGLGTPSCSSKSSGGGVLASGCSLNSDCNDPLVCIFALCHQACNETRDCSPGELCVKLNGNGVCELPQEVSCTGGQSCQQGLTCSNQQCRTSCKNASSDCLANQVCNGGACYDPTEIDGGAGEAGPGPEGGAEASGGDGGGIDATSDGPGIEAGPLGYVPSNIGSVTIADGGIPEAGEGGTSIVGADGGIDWSAAVDVTINSTSCTSSCLGQPVIITQSDLSQAELYVVKSLTVASSAILLLDGPRPVIVASLGNVDIQGSINVDGTVNGYHGAGGFPENGSQGPGAGGNGFNASYPTSAAGGGSFCGKGGTGAGTGLIAPGGSVYGNVQIVPLAAGSAGGYYSATSYSSYSGGAIQISSGTSIIVRSVGIINASGAGAYGGGASGGAILLEAPTITIQGIVAANGGAGGNDHATGANGTLSAQPSVPGGAGGAGAAGSTINGAAGSVPDSGATDYYGAGGGGAGYVRLNSADAGAGITGTVTPDLTTTCATQGTLQ
jgi:hypothetical protein